MKKLFLVALVFTFASTLPLTAGEKGWFGFEIKVAGEGFFNPTVRSITVESIAPHSPAAEQHIAVGDQIIQVENRKFLVAKPVNSSRSCKNKWGRLSACGSSAREAKRIP